MKQVPGMGIFLMNTSFLSGASWTQLERLATRLTYSILLQGEVRRTNLLLWLGHPLDECLRGLIEPGGEKL